MITRLCRLSRRQSENQRNEKRDHARELKKLWNMKVIVMLVVSGALGTIPKSLVKRMEEFKIEDEQIIFGLKHYDQPE